MTMKPKVHTSCYVHETAVIIGNVEIGQECGIWPHAVIRGDENTIKIDDGSNVQDCCVVHCSHGFPVVIGKNVSVGHGAVVHGATIEDDVIIGMNATVLNGSVVGAGSIIGANALVKEGMKIAPGSLVVGVPGKAIREGDASLRGHAEENAATYRELAKRHKAGAYVRYSP
jgi:carbonic anhydrase/acetyltransferase-like protein (isoleucine patch superfamily)